MRICLVYVTVPDLDVARKLARTLVEERLAACANILPGVESVYWWQGALESAGECVVLYKCPKERYPELAARIASLHPYDTPCIVAFPLDAGHEPFLAWVEEQTRP